MRLAVVVLLALGWSVSYAQGPRFRFYLTKSCTTTEQLDTSYYLVSVDSSFSITEPIAGTVYLPHQGRYRIGTMQGPLLDTIFEFKDTSLVVFRYKEPPVQLYVTNVLHSTPLYVRCGSPINGYAEAFYANGALKMRGTFTNGYTKDSVVTFRSNGLINKRVVKTRKLVNIQEFDIAGRLIKEGHSQNRSFMEYGESRWTDYFSDGSIKRKEFNLKHVVSIKEYYQSGKLKLLQGKACRNEFYENGRLKKSLTWKGKKEDYGKTWTATKKEYDDSGQLSEYVIYEIWTYNVNGSPPPFKLSESDWIISFVKYKGGQEVMRVEDMDTHKFLSTYPAEAGQADEW